MNALWITRMAAYTYLPKALESARRLIAFKIEREAALLRRYRRPIFVPDWSRARSRGDVLLVEARAARHFWREFKELVPGWAGFTGRRPRGSDIGNHLLDVGYHHLTTVVKKYLDLRQVPADLGLLHVARASDSAPLAYDLVELFRADTVDAELLRYLRLKKRPPASAAGEISHFLYELNERLARPHYLKDFCRCHSYRYYMEVQMLKFISAINHRAVFEPLSLPTRHENRCHLTGAKAVLSSRSEGSSTVR